MDLLIFFSIINLLIAFSGMIIGFLALFRLKGKLKIATFFITLSLFVFFVKEIFYFLGFFQLPLIIVTVCIFISLFNFLAILFIRETIKLVDYNLNHNSKKVKK